MAIMVDIDGIWCKKCQKMHPTLMWHEKYNDYELDRYEKWKKMIDKHFPNLKDGDVYPEFKDSLSVKGLKENNEKGVCIICKTPTYFKSLKTDEFVCCDECKYINEKREF